jgi:hypothetical protein
MQPSDLDYRKPYQPPRLRKVTSSQASLFLVGHAYIGHQGAKELLELIFPPFEDTDRNRIGPVPASLDGEGSLLHRRV